MKTCNLSKPKYTVQSILNQYFEVYLSSPHRKLFLEDHHLKAIHNIRACHTKRLGVHHFACTSCGNTHELPRSCKHRFCSKCGAADTHRWAEKMLKRLLNIKHHHVVFTLPAGLRGLSKLNGSKLHNLLFLTSSDVLKDWFKQKHGLKCGIVSVLHTNGSDLKYHPHIHMIVSGGGVNHSGEVEVLKKDYLCNSLFLGRQFKRVFITNLLRLYDNGELEVDSAIKTRIDLLSRLKRMSVNRQNWVVNIERPLEGIERLIAYVGRYAKRSCISEKRIKGIANGKLTLSYKDYKRSKKGEKPLENEVEMGIIAFLDRLLQHVPPPGYKVVRYYGIYTPSELKKLPGDQLGHEPTSECLPELETATTEAFQQYRQVMLRVSGKDPLYCYDCHQEMELIQVVYKNEKTGEIKVIEIERSD